MTYLFILFVSCFIVGVIGVAANPAPLFGAGSLVLGAVGGCGVLVVMGVSFIGLILLLIYLGGMLVVFAYSVALAAEPYPETWGDYSVLFAASSYGGLVLFVGLNFVEFLVEPSMDGGGFFSLRGDFSGVMLLFSTGGWLLLLSGWGLLLALFVVLELTRGRARGGLRVP